MRSCHGERKGSASGHGHSPRSWLASRLPLSHGHALVDTRWGIWGTGYPERAFRRHRDRVRLRRAGGVFGKPPLSMIVGALVGGAWLGSTRLRGVGPTGTAMRGV